MKTFLSPILVLCVISSYAQIGAKAQQGKIVGSWVSYDDGYEMILKFNTDGSGVLDQDRITYKVQGNNLIVTAEGEVNTYNFSLTDDQLKVSGGDLERPMTFKKTGTTNNTNKNTSPTTNTSTPGSSAKLVGDWSNYGETISFTQKQCTYQGFTYDYTVSGNNINLLTSQGTLSIGYSVDNNQLTLLVNGQTLTYNKGKSSSTTSPQASNAGRKKIDQSLVGKWCYVNVASTNSGGSSTDQCITINNDGTYQYYSERSMSSNTSTFSAGTSSQNSDSGTWWIEGDRVHYRSQNQGDGSYQLVKQNHPKTGDPMIVLDGTAYVTYYKKSPW